MATGRKIFLPLLILAVIAVAVFVVTQDEGIPPVEPAPVPAGTPTRQEPVTAPPIKEAVIAPTPPIPKGLLEVPVHPEDRLYAGRDDLFTLHGEVLDAVSEEPVSIYRMFCIPWEQPLETAIQQPQKARVFGNPLGTFTFRGLQKGRYNLLIRTEGYEELLVEGVVVPNESEKITLKLSRGAYIDVAVNDAEGDGVSDIEVRLTPVTLEDPAHPPKVRLKRTDDYGKALFTDVPSGTYTVNVASAGLEEHGTYQFYLPPGGSIPVEFTIPRLPTVLVTARDTEGNVLNLVQVRMWAREGKAFYRAETDRHGKARIEHVPPGEYTVKTYKLGFWRKDLTLAVPEGTGVVPLEIKLVGDPKSVEQELNPTPEQLERLKAGERPADVFRGKDDG